MSFDPLAFISAAPLGSFLAGALVNQLSAAKKRINWRVSPGNTSQGLPNCLIDRMSTGREDRIERLKQQIREVAGDEPFFSSIPACPPEIEEAFLERVLGFEQASRQPLRERLSDAGIVLTNPDELADNFLTQKMWDVIQALVTLHNIPINTDHLSDRQVYSHLWYIVRNGETVMPDFFSRGWYIDFTGQGERGMDVYVKYYASDDERRAYQRRFPHHLFPDHCEPPHDRDRLIPDL